MTITAYAKRELKNRVGYLRVREAWNHVALGPAALGARLFEDREVARLRAVVGDRPTARVATVIATYRRPELLERAVRSALGQSVDDHVVIVVDDGGGLALSIRDPRLVAVSLSRNCGILGLTRNVGIRLTRSNYVAFLDDDNEWEPDHLAIALRALGRGAGLVYTDLRRTLPDGRLLDIYSQDLDRRAMARGASPADSNAIVVERGPGRLFSRMRRGREVLPPEDWELVFRLSRRVTVEHVPVPTVRYLVNPSSYYSRWTDDLGDAVLEGAVLEGGVPGGGVPGGGVPTGPDQRTEMS